jgi:hypothetical protein
MKKTIIIIEDNFNDFTHIKSVIDSKFECRQQYSEDLHFNTDVKDSFINNLRNSLKITCKNQDEYDRQKLIKTQLQNELKGYCYEDEEPVYLIDYLLDGGSKENHINGINFREKILKEMYPDKAIPVLFITNANHSPKIRVENYIAKINDKTICDFQTKPNKKDWYTVKDKITDFINTAKSKPYIEKYNEPKSDINTEKDYQHD